MKTLVALWAAIIALAGGWLFWRNRRRYAGKTWKWLLVKSVCELLVVLLTATMMPALLIIWLVVWATSPIKKPWLRTVVGVFSGVLFGFLSNFALEILIFLGLFAVDLKTGESEGGFLNCWRRAKKEEQERGIHLVAA
jgi:hypothetical protein